MENKTEQTNKIKKRKLFPLIYVNKKMGLLRVINKNSTTLYRLEKHETKKDLDIEFTDTEEKEWTPEIEVEMTSGSGFKRVKPSEDKRWELWENN